MICVYCASHVPALLYLQIPGFEGRNVILIAYLIFVVQLSDVLQYVWGKLIGRPRSRPTCRPPRPGRG
jgi:phosphatidate cytidylyltransferase